MCLLIQERKERSEDIATSRDKEKEMDAIKVCDDLLCYSN